MEGLIPYIPSPREDTGSPTARSASGCSSPRVMLFGAFFATYIVMRWLGSWPRGWEAQKRTARHGHPLVLITRA